MRFRKGSTNPGGKASRAVQMCDRAPRFDDEGGRFRLCDSLSDHKEVGAWPCLSYMVEVLRISSLQIGRDHRLAAARRLDTTQKRPYHLGLPFVWTGQLWPGARRTPSLISGSFGKGFFGNVYVYSVCGTERGHEPLARDRCRWPRARPNRDCGRSSSAG